MMRQAGPGRITRGSPQRGQPTAPRSAPLGVPAASGERNPEGDPGRLDRRRCSAHGGPRGPRCRCRPHSHLSVPGVSDQVPSPRALGPQFCPRTGRGAFARVGYQLRMRQDQDP
ncbi:hypothetical protein NDU88_010407 [Pleurodeles waltl]|uniref:Uncharacterized protein n=1 Tax=Pleurodeles waltl TaxID=8319 RepID=A0AAV7QVU3_PLEWA|nr:hypothetical protein NDU88_010407 [Pleurodeles waltl]